MKFILLLLLVNSSYAIENDSLKAVVKEADGLEKSLHFPEENPHCINLDPNDKNTKNKSLALACVESLCDKPLQKKLDGVLDKKNLYGVSNKNIIEAKKRADAYKLKLQKLFSGYTSALVKLQQSTQAISLGKTQLKFSGIEILDDLSTHLNLSYIDHSFLVSDDTGSPSLIAQAAQAQINPQIPSILKEWREAKLIDDSEFISINNYDQFLAYQIDYYKKNNHQDLAEHFESLKNKSLDGPSLILEAALAKSLSNGLCQKINCDDYLNKKLSTLNISKTNECARPQYCFKKYLNVFEVEDIFSLTHHCDQKDLESLNSEVKSKFISHIPNLITNDPEKQKSLAQYFDKSIQLITDQSSAYDNGLFEKVTHKLKNEITSINEALKVGDPQKIAQRAFSNQVNIVSSVPYYAQFEDDRFIESDSPIAPIWVSRFSCANPEVGKQVTAHELGHALSSLLAHSMSRDNQSKSKTHIKLDEKDYSHYLKIRNCVEDGHKLRAPLDESNNSLYANSGFIHNGDSLRSEEDMADWIALNTYNDQSELMFCSIITPELSLNKELSIEYEGDKFKSEFHSSGLYRLLYEAYMKGLLKTHPNCQRFINDNDHLLNFRRCL